MEEMLLEKENTKKEEWHRKSKDSKKLKKLTFGYFKWVKYEELEKEKKNHEISHEVIGR